MTRRAPLRALTTSLFIYSYHSTKIWSPSFLLKKYIFCKGLLLRFNKFHFSKFPFFIIPIEKLTWKCLIITQNHFFHIRAFYLYFHFAMSKKRTTLKKRAAKASSAAIPYYSRSSCEVSSAALRVTLEALVEILLTSSTSHCG